MRSIRLALALALLCLPAFAQKPVGPQSGSACNQVAFVSPGAGTITSQLVAGATKTLVNFCGWQVTTAASSTFQFEYGTGASCTSPTAITPALAVTSTNPSNDHAQNPFSQSPAGLTLCVVTTAAIQVMVFYSTTVAPG